MIFRNLKIFKKSHVTNHMFFISDLIYLPLKINELQDILLGNSVGLLFNISLGSPEINFNWSSESKYVGLVVHLDTFLGLLYVFVQNISFFVVADFFILHINEVVFKFGRQNCSAFSENIL